MGTVLDMCAVAAHYTTAIVFLPTRFFTYWVYTNGLERFGDNAMMRLRGKRVEREEVMRQEPRVLNQERFSRARTHEEKTRKEVAPPGGGKVVGKIVGGRKVPIKKVAAGGGSNDDPGFRDFIPQNEPPPDRSA